MWQQVQSLLPLSPTLVGLNANSVSRSHAHTTRTGGIGVIGGIRLTPKMLQEAIDQIKENLEDKNAPFGIDLLIPQVGGSARKTNVSRASYCEED